MASKLDSYAQRTKWFHKARFGVFIHFGLYSLLGRGEWVMFVERIPARDYAKLARRFNPRQFDAPALAALIAQAGAKYALLTTRHHDGFCLYDSKVSDFTSVKTAAKRDLVAEFVTACRKAGLKVGLYYSLLDWRFPGGFQPDKYPDSVQAMVQQAHDQVRELMTNYGKIDVLWYDGEWIYHDEGREKQGAFWRATQLNAMVRRLQPHILINNRSGIIADFDTPEQHVTAAKLGRAWESCMTMGDPCGWGYLRHNPNFKTVPQLLQNLITAAAGEGNYLLNIGPKSDGSIRREEVTRLKQIGQWLKTNGQGIYGSQRCALIDRPRAHKDVGIWTRKGNTGYLHIIHWPGKEAILACVKTKALSAEILPTGQKVGVRQEYNGRLIFSGLPPKPPHPFATAIKVRFAGEPLPTKTPSVAWLTGQA